jgi:serine/threonine-protein kinase
MTSAEVHAPARLGRYELLARIAAGGMGEIFLARLDGVAGFKKLVVIKRILPHLADDARFRAMLIAEAQLASRMAHANICQVYELGEAGGQLYLAMEHLEGISLLQLLRRASRTAAPLELGFVAGVALQCAEALQYAHDLRDHAGDPLGIVHRDVTPGNVFLTAAGIVKLLDFGIAKVRNASVSTQTGTVKGKYAYMAPEQLRGREIDRRADLFALATVVYEMLALRRLFQRDTDYLTFHAVLEQAIPDLRRYRPAAPEPLAAVLARALSRAPEQRYPSARELAAAIEEASGERAWTQAALADEIQRRAADALAGARAIVASATSSAPLGADVRPAVDELVGARGASGAEPASSPVRRHDDDDRGGDDDLPPVDSPPDRAATSGGEPATHASVPSAFGASPSGGDGDGDGAPVHLATAPRDRRGRAAAFSAALVAVAAGAIAVAWRASRPPPPEIVLRAEPAIRGAEPVLRAPREGPSAAGSARAPEPGASPAEPAAPAGSSALGASAPPPSTPLAGSTAGAAAAPPPPPPRARRADPYSAVVAALRAPLTRCATDHGIPPGELRVKISVTAAGRPQAVTLEPASLAATPGGACLTRTLSRAVFPAGAAGYDVAFPMTVPRGAP